MARDVGLGFRVLGMLAACRVACVMGVLQEVWLLRLLVRPGEALLALALLVGGLGRLSGQGADWSPLLSSIGLLPLQVAVV